MWVESDKTRIRFANAHIAVGSTATVEAADDRKRITRDHANEIDHDDRSPTMTDLQQMCRLRAI
jgi:hypothetical protein